MTYTLITANRNYSSWSLRPWLLMKALGIPFAERFEPFTKPDNYEDFRRFSLTGQVPVLIDGDRVIPDSLGITLYLGERHDGVELAGDVGPLHAQDGAVEVDVVAAGQLGMEAGADLEQRPQAAADTGPAAGRLGDPRQDLDQRRLAGAVAADQRHHLARCHVQLHLGQRLRLAVEGGQSADLQHGVTHRRSTPPAPPASRAPPPGRRRR